jgi:hypothetical protein
MTEQSNEEEALRRIREAREKQHTQLDLSGCNLSKLPAELASLSNLATLKLNHNQIIDVTPLTSLSNLTWLELNHNQIVDVTPFASLSTLTGLILELNHNQIVDITPLASLSSLKWLCLKLNHNQIVDITPLASLSTPTWPELDHNQIVDVTLLASLSNLTWLSLWDNQIVDVTPLASLSNLTMLLLDYNQIVDVRPLMKLAELIGLECSYDKDGHIYVGGNPLQHPPVDIAEEGTEAVLTYFRNLKEQGEGKLNEAKLIIVGEPEAGKTSLMKKLLAPNTAAAKNKAFKLKYLNMIHALARSAREKVWVVV